MLVVPTVAAMPTVAAVPAVGLVTAVSLMPSVSLVMRVLVTVAVVVPVIYFVSLCVRIALLHGEHLRAMTIYPLRVSSNTRPDRVFPDAVSYWKARDPLNARGARTLSSTSWSGPASPR
jgi:hypothetical protein